jgi:hypothetical protein
VEDKEEGVDNGSQDGESSVCDIVHDLNLLEEMDDDHKDLVCLVDAPKDNVGGILVFKKAFSSPGAFKDERCILQQEVSDNKNGAAGHSDSDGVDEGFGLLRGVGGVVEENVVVNSPSVGGVEGEENEYVEEQGEVESEFLPEFDVVGEERKELLFLEKEKEVLFVLADFDEVISFFDEALHFGLNSRAINCFMECDFLLFRHVLRERQEDEVDDFQFAAVSDVDMRTVLHVEVDCFPQHFAQVLCFLLLSFFRR